MYFSEFPVRVYKEYDAIVSGGVEIRGLKGSAISRRKPAGDPVLEYAKFVAHRDGAEITLQNFTRIASHLILENQTVIKVKTIEAINDNTNPTLEDLVTPQILEILSETPLTQTDATIVASNDPFEEGILPPNITLGETKKLTAETAATLICGRSLFVSANSQTLSQLLVSLKEGGFLISRETGNIADIFATAKQQDLEIILEKRLKTELILMFRKRTKFTRNTTIINVSSDNFDWVSKLQEAITTELETGASGASRIILVSDKNPENGLLGFLNCLRREPGGEMIRGYLIQDKNAPQFSKDNPLYGNQLQSDLAVNVLRPNGTWGTYRYLQLPNSSEIPVYHAWATQLIRGDLSSLCWLQGPITQLTDQQTLARVAYASINFRDVMLATGKLAIEVVAKSRFHQECPYGLEYSGILSTGQPIMGLVESRGFTNIVIVDKHLSWPVPKDWTLEDAATVPCVYATCYYALYFNGKMKKGDKVLIHAGSGGVGQAAITLALHEGCEVFTTVGTTEKRNFIRKRFPEIPLDHIGNSRDTSFEQMIVRQTKGRGVDIVLNSLAEEKLQASVRCLATGGRFLEIGKFDLAANNPLGMKAFLREISFYGVMLDNLLTAPAAKKAELQKLLQAGLDSGAVKPLTRTVFPKEAIESAFRHMAAGKHIGKVLLGIHGKNEPVNSPVDALPRFNCSNDRSYVIIGGLGGFGLELVDWLVLRGAKNFVLTSRTGIKNGYQLKRIELWRSYGVKVIIGAGKDAAKRQDCEEILKTAAKLGPVDAIFNLAVVLKDGFFENQTVENFEESFKAKAWSTKQLDEVSRKLCPKLQHFVVFSSVSCGRGNIGQTNYGMANSVMERICERRVNEGLPGLAVQWGAVGDVGILVESLDENKNVVVSGTLPQGIFSCLAQLDNFLTQKAPIVSSMVVAEKRAGGAGALNIVDTVINIMGIKDSKSVSPHTSLAELGMDSMMAVEIKQTLEREFEIFLTAADIRGLNFAKLMEISAKDAEDKKHTNKRGTVGGETLVGMKMLIQLLGNKEVTTDICLKLHTKEEAGRNEVFLVPGIEGYGNVFHTLAGKIRSPATCLQLINNEAKKADTIDDMAERLLPVSFWIFFTYWFVPTVISFFP